MERLRNWLVLITAGLVLTIGGIAVWAFYIEPPFLSYHNLPFPADLQRVKPGQVMPLTVERCSTSKNIESYTITHELRYESGDRPAIVMPATLVTVPPGCHRAINLVNLVPSVTPPGRYRIYGFAIVQGSLRSFAVPWSSQPFEVVP